MQKIIFFLLFCTFIYTQTINVYLNNQLLTQEEILKLDIKRSDRIKIEFSSDSLISNYNIFLNGKDITSSQKANTYAELTSLPAGSYIVKLIGKYKDKTDTPPYVIRFSVSEETVEKAKPATGVFLDPVTLIIIIICISQTIIIFILYRRKNKTVKIKDDSKEKEILELKSLLDRNKKNISAMEQEKSTLKNQVSELSSTIKELETTNDELLYQKEKLQQKKAELEELQRQKDELFAMAVHDIKNPVSVIRSLIQLLESYDLTATEQQEIMQTLVDSSENIMKLTREMTEVIKKQKTDNYLEIEPTSLKDIIDTVVNLNLSYAKKKGIKIVNRSSNSLPEMSIDKLKIQEVLDNLVNNAIKYGPENTIVEIKAYFSDTKVTVEVADNGVGLSEHDLMLLFSKGVTLSAQPTGGEHSSGLGLWISKRIIDEHKGKIWVKSKLGSGSTFGFDLPK